VLLAAGCCRRPVGIAWLDVPAATLTCDFCDLYQGLVCGSCSETHAVWCLGLLWADAGHHGSDAAFSVDLMWMFDGWFSAIARLCSIERDVVHKLCSSSWCHSLVVTVDSARPDAVSVHPCAAAAALPILLCDNEALVMNAMTGRYAYADRI
jgi:hypothetical protein